MRVLHGMSEVAGQGIYTVKGLIENNVESNMVVWRRNSGGYDIDIDLNIGYNKLLYPIYAVKMHCFAIKAIKKYDIFHFHYGYSLTPFYWDLQILKHFSKKIFVEFHGSEIRGLYKDINYDFFNPEWPSIKNKRKQRKRIRKLLEYADGIILHDEELRAHIPDDIDVPVYIVPLRVDINKFEVKHIKNKIPIIVHAPSRRSTKGTEGILEALKAVSGKYELILVEGKTQKEAFDIYKRADLIIDQISVGTYGVFAIEGMALGKPVITYIDEKMKKNFPQELPIISANFENLGSVVEELVNNRERLESIGERGREYVERFHDNIKVTKHLKKIYEGQLHDDNVFHIL